jgi:hypothetical protein
MNANQMERAAYMAAHRILTTNVTAPELACPGARRSAMVDNSASIIVSIFEAHSQRFDETTDWWPAHPEIPSELTSLPRPAPLRALTRGIDGPAVRSLR